MILHNDVTKIRVYWNFTLFHYKISIILTDFVFF